MNELVKTHTTKLDMFSGSYLRSIWYYIRGKARCVVEITGGMDQADMSEERCDNLMDHRGSWNVSFNLNSNEEREYCMSAGYAACIEPDTRLFSPELIQSIQQADRNRDEGENADWLQQIDRYRDEKKKWWQALIDRSQQEQCQSVPHSAVWHFAGKAHCWADRLDNATVFAEYDANVRHGYALVVSDNIDVYLLFNEFGDAHRFFRADTSDEEILWSKW